MLNPYHTKHAKRANEEKEEETHTQFATNLVRQSVATQRIRKLNCCGERKLQYTIMMVIAVMTMVEGS